jgi:hypothetical protein
MQLFQLAAQQITNALNLGFIVLFIGFFGVGLKLGWSFQEFSLAWPIVLIMLWKVLTSVVDHSGISVPYFSLFSTVVTTSVLTGWFVRWLWNKRYSQF